LARPEFLSAVGRYIREERRHIERYMAAIGEHSPYRVDGDGPDNACRTARANDAQRTK
jgi:hypothetical protein